jgi:beta-glucanase (GH16 family)
MRSVGVDRVALGGAVPGYGARPRPLVVLAGRSRAEPLVRHNGQMSHRHGAIRLAMQVSRRSRYAAAALVALAGAGAIIGTVTLRGASAPARGCGESRLTAGASRVASSGVASTGTRDGLPASSKPWQLAFNDDFSGANLDTARWAVCYPRFNSAGGCTNFGNDELEWYKPSQVQISGNALHLVAQKLSTAGMSSDGRAKQYPWTSGMVTTFHGCDFTYGYVRVVAKLPKGSGFWPALWLLPVSRSWPPEIDMMENHGQDPHAVQLTYHQSASIVLTKTFQATQDPSTLFHTYAVNWQPGSITWYIDGRKAFQLTSGVPSEPMYFIANLAVDGMNGLAPNTSTPSSASFDIESVQIWQN